MANLRLAPIKSRNTPAVISPFRVQCSRSRTSASSTGSRAHHRSRAIRTTRPSWDQRSYAPNAARCPAPLASLSAAMTTRCTSGGSISAPLRLSAETAAHPGSLRRSLEQTKAGLRFKSPKNGKARAITLPAFAIDKLRRLKQQQAEELLRLGVRQDGATLLCCRADGKPMQPRSLTHEFTVMMARLKDDLPRVRFHDLRHCHATQLLLAGVHPKIAQERLGHATISITLDLYSHVSATMQEDAASKIDAAFRGAKMRPAG